MINSIATAIQTVANGQNVLFPTDRVRTKSCQCACKGWLAHDVGSGQFILINNGCGCDVFEIRFNTNLTSDTVGALALVIQANGEAIGGTEMDYTPAEANVYASVSASTLVKVPAGGSVTITVKNISASSVLVKDSNIIIKKIA